MRLVSARGLAAVTVEEIATEADVSTRTFFNYFSSKEDVVSGMDPALMDEVVERLRMRPREESAVAALRAVLLDTMAPADADRDLFLARMRLTWSDPRLLSHHAACWADRERRLVSALAERRGVDPARDRYGALLAAASLAAARVAQMSWCKGEGEGTLADELALHLDVLDAGLAEPEPELVKRRRRA